MTNRTLQECYHQGRGDLAPPGQFNINHQFNRLEYIDHAYRVHHGIEPLGKSYYDAVIKCKLVINRDYLNITPDLIYIITAKNEFKWFQFFHFLPGIFDSEKNFKSHNFIDISGGHKCIISFGKDDYIKKLADDSVLYKCKIRGPKNIRQYATGKGKIINGIPYIYLYHHTKDKFKKMILESKNLLGSKWNYQGNKKLKNVEYCYFTSIDMMKMQSDLKMIAMSTDAQIKMIVDKTMERISVKIPRQSTLDRKANIKFLIDGSLISNNHINQRMWDEIENIDYFYEIKFPYIFRVGIKPGTSINFKKDMIVHRSSKNISPNYIIMGKSTSKKGLLAPFHEEETDFIGKIFPISNSEIISTAIHCINKERQIFNQLNAKYVQFE